MWLNLQKSKIAAIAALVLTIAAIIFTAVMHAPWWWFAAEFMAYMSAFSHLMALLLVNLNRYVGRILDRCSLVFGLLFIVALIVLYFLL